MAIIHAPEVKLAGTAHEIVWATVPLDALEATLRALLGDQVPADATFELSRAEAVFRWERHRDLRPSEIAGGAR